MIKGVDLSKFKKVDSNRDHTVFQSEDGHLIYVSNKSINKDVHEALRNLPIQKMSQGGTVKPRPRPGTDEEAKKIQDSFNNASWKKMADGGTVGLSGVDADKQDLENLKRSLSPAVGPVGQMIAERSQPGIIPSASAPPEAGNIFTPVAPDPSIVAMNEPKPEVIGSAPAAAPNTANAIADYKTALSEESVLAEAKAKKEQEALTQQIAQEKKYITDVQDIQNKKRAAYEDFAKFISDPANQVNPQRLMGNQGTWGRLMTGIGLAIGGAPTRAFLEKQIDEDIKQQQKMIDNKSTLYAKNLELLGDEEKALSTTKMQAEQIVINQLKNKLLNYASPQAQINGQKLVAEMTMKHGEQLAKEAQADAQKQMLGAAQAPVSPDMAAKLVGSLVPKEKQAEAAKEVEHAKKIAKSFVSAKEAFDSAKKVSSVGALAGRLVPGYETDAEAKLNLANASLQSILRENKPPGSGVMTDADAAAIIEPFLIKATDGAEAIDRKRQAFMKKLQSMYSENQGTLAASGIKLAEPKVFNFSKEK